MNLIFWQNCVSPHQFSYIKELYRDQRICKIILIAPFWESLERKKMGWNYRPNTENVEILILPNEAKINRVFFENQENTIHLFSGIRADKFVFECFKLSLNYSIKRGLITEQPFIYNKPLILHKIRFFLFDYKYISKFEYVFGMGNNAVNYYSLWSKKWKVFLFGYCIENNSIIQSDIKPDVLRFLYVGSLSKRKNVRLLLRTINRLQLHSNFSLDIIGDGEEFYYLSNYVQKKSLSNYISFIGQLTMSEIHNKLSQYDVLVLPSFHDGWGAVINEGIQSGLFIVSSDHCGGKTLVEHSNRGIIFKSNSLNSLENALKYCIANSDGIKLGKQDRILWSERISGVAIAKYMVDCLHTLEHILPPWKDTVKLK